MSSTSLIEVPIDADGIVDYNLGWKLWADMARYYPAAVHRRRLIRALLAPTDPKTVLDVGCGTGVLLEEIHRLIPAARCTGVDFADETVADNQKRWPWAEFATLDVSAQSLDQRFDAVICSEVLEHVADDDGALANLVAMTGKYLCITVPTGQMFSTEIAFGHLRHYDIGSLCRRIEGHGLRIVRAERWGFPWMSAFKRATNLRAASTMETFGGGKWAWHKRAFARALTALFYLNVRGRGPQLLVLAERPEFHLT